MTKIAKIGIVNLKAVSKMEADFNGCSVIITAGNNKGKSTFLRSIPDRIRGEKADLILKQGEENGSGYLELTTGEKFEWEFNDKGKDKLTYITKEGYKVAVTKAIANKFFPPVFDIDNFLAAEPKKQSKMLQVLVGLDFSEIDLRYKAAYDERTDANRIVKEKEQLLSQYKVEPEKVEPVVLDDLLKEKDAVRAKLNKEYSDNKAQNDSLRTQYQNALEQERVRANAMRDENAKRVDKLVTCNRLLAELMEFGYKGNEVTDFINSLPQPEKYVATEIKEPTYIKEMPDDVEMKAIDAKIANATEINAKAQEYIVYRRLMDQLELARTKANDIDMKVKSIEQQKSAMVLGAKLPDGLAFTDDGITVDGLPLDKNQLSSSKIYITALRLASLNLGEVKSLYFDASTLDNNSLAEVEAWAKEKGLQLLIEMPDRSGGDIAYQLIQE